MLFVSANCLNSDVFVNTAVEDVCCYVQSVFALPSSDEGMMVQGQGWTALTSCLLMPYIIYNISIKRKENLKLFRFKGG